MLIVTLALTSACGVKSAYNNADWLIMRWVNDRVDLEDEQERAVRASIENTLTWHCRSELPDYIDFLRRVEADVTAERVDAPTIESYGRQVTDFGRRILTRVRPDLIELLADLNDDQVEELIDSFEERNLELREEADHYEDEDAVEERAERMGKSMRRFAGRPTDQQLERLHHWAVNLQSTAEQSLAHRLAWQSAFERTMANRHDRPTFDHAMRELLQPGALASEAYQQRRERNRNHTIQALAEVHALSTEDQIKELKDNLSGFSEQLVELSCS